jgi:hypothetical protein
MGIELAVVMNLVSLRYNFSPRELWDLARLCVWLELVPPSLIGIFGVLILLIYFLSETYKHDGNYAWPCTTKVGWDCGFYSSFGLLYKFVAIFHGHGIILISIIFKPFSVGKGYGGDRRSVLDFLKEFQECLLPLIIKYQITITYTHTHTYSGHSWSP